MDMWDILLPNDVFENKEACDKRFNLMQSIGITPMILNQTQDVELTKYQRFVMTRVVEDLAKAAEARNLLRRIVNEAMSFWLADDSLDCAVDINLTPEEVRLIKELRANPREVCPQCYGPLGSCDGTTCEPF